VAEQCTSCGAKILEATFHRTSGLCKPCWKTERRKRIGQTPFGIAYDTHFHRPGRLAGEFFDYWIDLELRIAGPLFAARDRGDVRYVFKKKRIDGVENFNDLVAWMNSQVAHFRNRVLVKEATSSEEARSRDALLSRAADLEALIALWPDFDKEFGRGAA
jgi:hypothetical protein